MTNNWPVRTYCLGDCFLVTESEWLALYLSTAGLCGELVWWNTPTLGRVLVLLLPAAIFRGNKFGRVSGLIQGFFFLGRGGGWKWAGKYRSCKSTLQTFKWIITISRTVNPVFSKTRTGCRQGMEMLPNILGRWFVMLLIYFLNNWLKYIEGY